MIREASAATAALAAGLTFNAAPGLADNNPDDHPNNHLTECLRAGASLPGTEGLKVVDRRRIRVRLGPMAMDRAFPECEDVEMRRDTDVRVYVNGRLRGEAEDVLNPRVDDGRPLRRILKLKRALRIGDRVTGKFITTARADGEKATDIDRLRFRVTPR